MYKPKSSSHCCLLFARCVKLRKSRIKNLSHRLFHLLNRFRCSFHLCPTAMTTSSGATCLYLVSRERGLQKLHSFCCANAPTVRPFAVGNVRRIEKHVPRRGSEGRKTKGNLCSPKSVIESQKRADAWERIWRSDDGNGLSKYRWSDWLRENTVESISRLTDTSSRTHRTSERSSRRAPAAVCPIQTSTRRVSLSHVAGGGRRGLIPTVRSQGAGHTTRRRKGRRGTRWDNLSCRCLQRSSMAQ